MLKFQAERVCRSLECMHYRCHSANWSTSFPDGAPAGRAASERPPYSVRKASMGSVLAAFLAGIIAAAKAAAASAQVVTSKTIGS